jgi:hypothetical protein
VSSDHASQGMRILAYLQSGRTLTALEALDLFGTIRLPSRIHALRRLGHKIISKMVTVERRDGSHVRVARYEFVAQVAA